MPVYTIDNPSSSDLNEAECCIRGLLGDNCISVSSITKQNTSRVSVETVSAINTNDISSALAKLGKAAAEKPAAKQTEVTNMGGRDTATNHNSADEQKTKPDDAVTSTAAGNKPPML